jgi:tetratricopeptide (TPR) repeat protein
MFFNNAVNFYSKDDFSHSKQEFLKCKGINDSTIKAEIYFYLGNIDYKEQKYFEAIDNYKNALRLNSSFNEAKNNLVLARLKLNEEKRKNKNPDLQNSSTKQTNEILLESKLLENKALEKANNNENKNNHSQQIKNW